MQKKENNTTENQNKTLSVVNQIFLGDCYSLKDNFDKALKEYFWAPTKMCRFREQTKEETERINEFVSSKTNGLIKNLIPPNVITQSTCMVLVNAIYFLDKW